MTAYGWFNNELLDTPHIPNSLRTKYIKHITTDGVDSTKDKEQGIGRIYELYGLPNFDLAFQGRAILGGSKIKFKVIPNPAEFYLMCSDEKIIPRVEFVELALNITRARVNPEVVFGHHRGLEITPARYPLCRTDVRTTTISNGTLNTY